MLYQAGGGLSRGHMAMPVLSRVRRNLLIFASIVTLDRDRLDIEEVYTYIYTRQSAVANRHFGLVFSVMESGR